MARGGQQQIPRPSSWQPGAGNPWLHRRDEGWRYDPAWVQTVLTRSGDPRFANVTTPMRPPFLSAHKQSAVLAVLFHRDDELRVLLTRRDARLRNHKGEVAFPGGRLNDGERPLQAALRETHEEVALDPTRISILGQLEPLTTVVSASAITPFVGYLAGDLPQLTPNPGEVDRVFDVSLHELTHPDCFHEEIWPFEDGVFPVWFFAVEHDTIWGATGRMLRRLLDLVLLTDAE